MRPCRLETPDSKKRCKDEFTRRQQYSDIIMASHSLHKINEYCQSAFVLAHGKLHPFEDLDEAIQYYEALNMVSPHGRELKQDDLSVA